MIKVCVYEYKYVLRINYSSSLDEFSADILQKPSRYSADILQILCRFSVETLMILCRNSDDTDDTTHYFL